MKTIQERITIKNLIKDNFVRFSSFKNGIFYMEIKEYQQEGIDDNCYDYNDSFNDEIIFRFNLYSFPVPLEELGTGTLLATDKALYYMRWIRKALEEGTMQKV